MYRNRKYRSGTSSLLGRQVSNVNATDGNQSNANATDTTASISHISHVLTDRAHTIPEEGGDSDEENVPLAKVQKSSVNRLAKRRPTSPIAIPASQTIPVSCYVSQRSILQRTQSYLSGNTSQRVPITYFERVLEKCGMTLPNGVDSNYQLSGDHLQFVMALRAELCANPQFPENTQQFLSGLQELMKSQLQLVKLLSGCAIRLPDGETTRPSQESLMQDLLMIDFLQADIIEILLSRMKVVAIDEHFSHLQVELILSQLKFVDHFANGDNLFERMMDILQLVGNEACETIIRYLPDIIDTTKHNAVVEKLIELKPNDEALLTETAIDSFSNMAISAKQHAQICQKIIRYMKSNAPIQLWPTLIKFILNFNHQSGEILASTIDELRDCLKFHLHSNENSLAEIQKDVFNCISRSLIRSKLLFDTWLKVIQSKCERMKSIDFIILLMMMTIKDERSTYIENIIRRKIKTEVIQIELVKKLIDELPAALLEHFGIFLELMDVFLRGKNDVLVKFASAAFKHAFGIRNCDTKKLLMKLIGFVCEKRTSLAVSESGAGVTFDVTTNALMVLMEINVMYPLEMQKNGFQILRMLDHVQDMTLLQFRIVMDILCSLAYAEPQCEMTKDHIDMLVKKQVSSSIRGVKNRGIIGAVRVIDHIVWDVASENMDVDNDNDLDQSFNTIEELPNVSSRSAAQLVDMLITSTLGCPYHLGLVLDELASIFQIRNKKYRNGHDLILNRHFRIWICDLMSQYFEQNFVVEECQEKWPSLKFEFLYALNALNESENMEESGGAASIAIDVAGGVVKSSTNAITSITVLPSLFNLMRILQSRRYGGLLTAIDAVLGAAVVLPTIMAFPHECNIFDEHTEDTCKKILDMYYHTVNFWRECVSAYVSQHDAIMRRKVLTRLSEIIRFELRIKEQLHLAPDDFDYTPPICQFASASNNVGKHITRFKKPYAKHPSTSSRKKASPKSQNETTMPNLDAELNLSRPSPTATAQRDERRRGGASSTAAITIDCDAEELHRAMDPDIMLLFEEQLLLKYPMTQNTIGTALGVLEFKFLMEHVIKKVESIIGIAKASSQYDMNVIHPDDFISDLVQILPKIMAFFKQLASHLKGVVNAGHNDSTAMDVDNCSQLFTDETNYIKICFGLCMRLLSGLYSWTAFDNDDHHSILQDSLRAIVGEQQVATDAPIAKMALTGIEGITADSNVVLDLRSAVYMFTLIKSLVKLVNEPQAYEKYVGKLCHGFLANQWYDQHGCEERGNQCNILLDTLLKGYFKDAKFTFIKRHVDWIDEEVKQFLPNKNSSFKTFPCFSRNNFSVLFRVMYSSLNETLERKIDKKAQSIGQLKLWEKSHQIITQMLEIVKKLDMPRNFSLFLKYTQIYLKLFLVHGMPVIERLLLKNAERVSEFLKNLQHTTRFLHNVCVHSKEIKNTIIIAQIPTVRETVEQLVFKVKGALAANNCSSVFWMGNLKNKNLHGDEIASQTSSMTRTEEDDDDGVHDETDDDGDDAASRVSSNASNEGNVSEDDAHSRPSTRAGRHRQSRIGPNLSRSRSIRLN